MDFYYEKSGSEPAAPQVVSNVWKNSSPSTVLVEAESKDGRGIINGVVIDKSGVIATTALSLTNADRLKVHLQSGKFYQAKIEQIDPQANLALIRPLVPEGDQLPFIEIRDTPLKSNEQLFAVGAETNAFRKSVVPGSFGRQSSILGLMSERSGATMPQSEAVSDLRGQKGEFGSLCQYLTESRLVTRMAPGHGQGGSAIVDSDGKLVGLLSETSNDTHTALAIPVDTISAHFSGAKSSEMLVEQSFHSPMIGREPVNGTARFGVGVAITGCFGILGAAAHAYPNKELGPANALCIAGNGLFSSLQLPFELYDLSRAGDRYTQTDLSLRVAADAVCVGAGALAARGYIKGKMSWVAPAAYAASWALELTAEALPTRLTITGMKRLDGQALRVPSLNTGFDRLDYFAKVRP